ncbi:ribokinase [Massilia endophytica]|uniref:ribokinase n=1 Tax=Massilia endophytica TaxID=2899220 RepID=UPI001E516C2C|nr:ribokinase [Massilia endophytica]UGQ46719.1 ribokinase [Massilia endophytica]
MTPRITIVGSINIDLVFRTPRMPMLGETISGEGFRQVAGGKGANQAVAAARQGAEVHFVGAVGDDAFGRSALDGLRGDGIGTGGIAVVPGVATGVAGIFVDDSGANSIVIAPGANDTLDVAQVEACATTITGSSYLVCQLETPLATVTRAIEIARAAGVKVVLNAAPAADLPGSLLAMCDYLVVNETEASQLSGVDVRGSDDAVAAARALCRRGAGAVLLTMGESGVVVSDCGTQHLVPAAKVQPVDTTAAGDTFVGALTVALARGLTLEAATREAQYAAALAVTRIGAQTSIPTREELQQFIDSRGGRAALGLDL